MASKLVAAVVCCLSCSIAVAQSPSKVAPSKVGVVLPLSGPVAKMGHAVKNGIVLYQERVPDKAKSLQFVFEDGRYDGKDTVAALSKLANVDRVKLAMVWGNTPAGAAASISEQLKLDTVMISHDDHSARSHVIDIGPSADSCIPVMADNIKRHGSEKFGVIGIDIGNVIKFLDTLDDELGTRLNRQIVSSDATQFQTQLLRGKKLGITSYFVALMPEQALIFAKQAKDLKLDFSVLGIDTFADDQFLSDFQKLLPETSFVYSSVEPWFVDAYRQRFGNGSFLLEAASGYVFAQISDYVLSSDGGNKPFQERIKEIDLSGLAYRDPRLSQKGLRISSPCQIVMAKEYISRH